MATLRAVLDASAFVGGARQVAQASQQVAQSTVQAGRGLDALNNAFTQASNRAEVTRESIKAVAGTVQTAAGFRQLTQAVRELDGSFASIVNAGAQASVVLLNFARAADDVRQLREAINFAPEATQALSAVDEFNALFKDSADTSRKVTTSIAAQKVATDLLAGSTATAATATRGFAGATALLSAAWKAHPVLIVATVLAAATAAMAAFAGNTKEATEESKRLAEQQQALQRSLENIQRIQAEARVGTQFGIAGAAEEARRREQQAVFQQAVEVETQRFRGGGGVQAQTLAAGRQVEEILNAQQTLRFEREYRRRVELATTVPETRASAALQGAMVETGRRIPMDLTPTQLQEIQTRIREEVRQGFTIGYEDALGILQGRFDEIGKGLEQSLVPLADAQRQRVVAEFRQQVAPTPLLSEQEYNLQRQEGIDADLQRLQLLNQIQSGIAEEARLAGLTTNEREQELVVLRALQQAQQAGVALSEADLAALREAVRLTQERSAAEAQARFNREVVEPSAEGLRLAGFSPAEREAEQAVAAARAQAAQAGRVLRQEEERDIRANIAAQQELNSLRAIQQAQQAGVALSEADLAALREAVRLTQERSAAEAQARFNREVVEPSAEGLRLAGFSPAEREAEQAVAAARAQAAQTGATLGQAEERQIRANIAAQQELNSLRATGEAVGAAIGNSFVNAATGVATLRQALAGLLQDLIRIAAQRAILGPLADAFGSAFAGGPKGQGTTVQQATFDTGANAGTYASTVPK